MRAALAFHVAVRTRFFDDDLATAAAAGRQVVLLAAGLDSRAFRLPWPDGVRLFELDLPAVLAFKDRVLTTQGVAARCERTAVGVDLRTDWSQQLTAAGFTATAPTAWLAEGLLVYLSAAEAARVLTAVTDLSAPGSQLALERGGSTASLRAEATAVSTTARTTAAAGSVTELWQGGLGSDTPAWLARNGWHVRTHEVGPVAASYGRAAPASARSGFITATRDA